MSQNGHEHEAGGTSTSGVLARAGWHREGGSLSPSKTTNLPDGEETLSRRVVGRENSGPLGPMGRFSGLQAPEGPKINP
ncbi:hypothetical protein EDF60_0558 [Leucobacter luti]|nr:hypothetical protein [Leucobacter luti]TCK45332.1 hypothetical protein EDF60_0558 [Leucobacter luti]